MNCTKTACTKQLVTKANRNSRETMKAKRNGLFEMDVIKI